MEMVGNAHPTFFSGTFRTSRRRGGALTAPTKTFQGCHSWAFDPPVKPEKLVLAGGAAFPGCARLTCFLDTGWKACATDLKNFSGMSFMGLRPTRKT